MSESDPRVVDERGCDLRDRAADEQTSFAVAGPMRGGKRRPDALVRSTRVERTLTFRLTVRSIAAGSRATSAHRSRKIASLAANDAGEP